MKAPTTVPFVDTNIVPDRNAGIGSLLWDLQHPQEPDRDGSPLLGPKFAFIDVGVSRARVATALKALLAGDLRMDVDYVATERPDAVPSASVTLLGDRAEQIRGHLSRMMVSKQAGREVTSWHYVADRTGRVSSVAYSYPHFGNEVCEAYFMGRAFMFSGRRVEFSDAELDAMLAPDVRRIEASLEMERRREHDVGQPAPAWDGYRVERHPLEAGLAACGIPLQQAEVPQRIAGRQNVLFLGNVLDHYPHDERARVLDRISANLEEGDLVIVQLDGVDASSLEVLRVRGRGARTPRERVRWINTRELEIQMAARGAGPWRLVRVKPVVDQMVSRLIECLGPKVSSPERGQRSRGVLAHPYVSHVFRTYFRAWPVEETIRVAVREALRRIPSDGGPRGNPVLADDPTDAYGCLLGSDLTPVVNEADRVQRALTNPRHGGDGDHAGDAREAGAGASA